MGNICSYCNGQMFVTKRDRNGNVYEELVCDRCHRNNHTSYECYANTSSDGSLINPVRYCSRCNTKHRGPCNDTICRLL